MQSSTRRLIRPFLMVFISGSMLLAGCSSEVVLTPSAESSDRTQQPLTSPGGALLTPRALKGVYGGGCKLHNNESWALRLNDPTDTSLEVLRGDTLASCPLTLTAVEMQVGPYAANYTLSPSLSLDLSYLQNPPAGTPPPPSSGVAFYLNARLAGLQAPVYSAPFAIDMIYSDSVLACAVIAPPAVYSILGITATGNPAPAPNYTLGFDGFQLIVDANNVVQGSSSGSISLKLSPSRGQPGEEWKLFGEPSGCCTSGAFYEIDAVYQNGRPNSSAAIGTALDISLPWRQFDLEGRSLPLSRAVIVKHTDSSGIYSYEVLNILFPGPDS